ncbi:sensor histidine kinase [Novosphingobium terrae]|uniref:sensor histidine kinase n=1 Tax=Novosphingobium terrae TaxID=2726189 RepID=UPI00197CF690|nr:sensor histidine kinase [Novosphingobium terrae]
MLHPRPALPNRWRLAVAFALALMTGAGEAQQTAPAFPNLTHAALTAQQGAPPGISAMAQGPEGYLWLAARDGLWRYDGTSFEHIPAPHGARFAEAAATSLIVTQQGEVWVGYGASGGVAVFRGGRLMDGGMREPPPQIVNLLQGPDGAIWAQWGGIDKRLWRYAGGHWALMDDAFGLPPGYAMPLIRRSDGSLWLPVMSPEQDGAGLAELRPGEHRFRWHPGRFEYPVLAEDAHGQLWVGDRHAITRLDADGRATGPAWPAVPGTGLPTLRFDKTGGLWETTRTKGLLHIANPDDPASRAQVMDAQGGLTSDQTRRMLQDRNGTVWVSTEEGLDRFTRAPIAINHAIATSPIDGIAFAASRDGAVHILNHGNLYDIAMNGPARLRMRLQRETTLCETTGDALWLADSDAMFRLEGHAKRDVSPLPVHMPFGCLRDPQGRSWVLGEDHAVWWQDQAGWHRAGQGKNLLLPGAGLRLGRQGHVAFADGVDGVTVVEGSAFRRIALAPLKLGQLRGIDAGERGFLFTMELGVARLRDGHLAVLTTQDQPWLRTMRTVVRGARGESWFYGPGRLAMVSAQDLDAGFEHPGRPIPHRLLDTGDGLPVTMQHPGFIGTQALAGADGRLWLASASGVAMLDPRTLPALSAPPAVRISGLTFSGGLLRDPDEPVLPPGSSTIRLAYTSPGAAAPEALHFRFRLDGVDNAWVEAENRRATTYTNLGPGRYTFHVQAAGGDGVWGPESLLHLTIRPGFVQDWPFKLLCAGLAVLLLWLAYHARMRAVAAHVRLRMEERHDERERIARELHDTLLQSIQGLILHVEVAAQDLPPREAARLRLEQALDNTQDAVVELRERVETLRLPQAPGDLESSLRRIAQTVLGDRLPCRTMVSGVPQDLSPLAAHELSALAREVFFNALRHAGAKEMLVSINWRRARLDLCFADDGVGIDPAILEAGFREGHFGLPGMRERVARLKGRISIANGASGGLEIMVSLPARTVYADPRGIGAGLLSWLREE